MPILLPYRMQQLSGNSAEWTADDITLLQDEIGLELTPSGEWKAKIGDGLNPFSALPYLVGRTTEELETIIDARIAAHGISVSSGAADGDKLVRLNSQGKLDSSVMPSDYLDGVSRFMGFLNMRDNGPPSNPNTGEWYRNTHTGTYHADWGPNLGGLACVEHDFVVWTGPNWRLLSRGQLIDLGELQLRNEQVGTQQTVESATHEGTLP